MGKIKDNLAAFHAAMDYISRQCATCDGKGWVKGKAHDQSPASVALGKPIAERIKCHACGGKGSTGAVNE